MSKIQRVLQKIFGVNAPADDIAAMGSFKTGTPLYTDNITTLQNTAYEQGYGAAIVADEAPFMEEQNSIPYIFSTQLAYLFQEGIPEYDAGTTYYIGSIVKLLDTENNIPQLYYSLTDDNTGNEITNAEHWQKVELGGNSGNSNNPYVLFEPKYFEQNPQNISWVKAGSQLTKAEYPSAYNAAVIEQNALIDVGISSTIDGWTYIKRGLPVVLSTATDITNYDIVLDTENETVTLPSASQFKFLSGLAGVKGNGKAMGVSWNGTSTNAYTAAWMYSNVNSMNFATSDTVRNSAPSGSGQFVTIGGVYGLTPVTSQSNVLADLDTAETVGELYFYVGDTVQNANIIDVASRADTNLSNITQSAINNIMNYVMPDYTAGVGKPVNIEYTAETAGLLECTSQQDNASVTSIYINGVLISKATAQTNQRTNNSYEFLIGKGDTYKVETTNTPDIYYCTFYPCKGTIS